MITLLTAALVLLPAPPLEGADHLDRFFSRLDQPASRVRVTHFGDSHVAADLWTGPMRAALQARFGDGGRGLVLAGRPWASAWQSHLVNRSDGEWDTVGLRGGLDDGWFGAAGCAVATADPRASFTVGPLPGAAAGQALATVDVHYLREPRGGCLEVRADGRTLGRVATRGPWVTVGFARLAVPPGTSTISVHPIGDAPVRVLGASLEGPGGGLVYVALGLNGARATRPLRLAPATLPATLGRLQPTLVVVSYGVNELFDGDLDLGAWGAGFGALLSTLREASPADCLVTGPPDAARRGRPLPAFDAMVALQRALADAHGCAFWDAREAMGGAGGVVAWRRAGLARRDGVHLTRDGYQRLAGSLVDALMAARDERAHASGRP